jgi:hypothetical protein
MTTKANRTRAAERIEKAKKAYGLAEVKADNVILRLAATVANSPWTLVVVLATLLACIVVMLL